MPLPTMSEKDRQAAREKAQQARTARRELLEKLKTGQTSIADALEHQESAIQKIKVSALLKALPGYGNTKVSRLMEHAGIAENRRIRGLGAQQRHTLLTALGSDHTEEAHPEPDGNEDRNTRPEPENNVTALPRSIQGEQHHESGPQRASETDVDAYVDRVSDEVLACRERGRHLFPSIREAGIVFTGVDDNGLFLRRLTCTCCGLAVKVEKWEAIPRSEGLGRGRRRTRFERVGANLEYRTGPEGQSYLAPSGRGHMIIRTKDGLGDLTNRAPALLGLGVEQARPSSAPSRK
jgi:hypothetical protein